MLLETHIARTFAALSATNEAILYAKSPEELYRQVGEAAFSSGDFLATAVFLLEPGTSMLRLAAGQARLPNAPDHLAALRSLRPERVCLIKPSSLGDVVHALPVLSALRTHWPDAHLAWVVNRGLRGLLDGHPDLDEVIPFDRAKLTISPGGMVWISYPKGKSLETDLNRDVLREELSALGLEAVRQIATGQISFPRHRHSRSSGNEEAPTGD